MRKVSFITLITCILLSMSNCADNTQPPPEKIYRVIYYDDVLTSVPVPVDDNLYATGDEVILLPRTEADISPGGKFGDYTWLGYEVKNADPALSSTIYISGHYFAGANQYIVIDNKDVECHANWSTTTLP